MWAETTPGSSFLSWPEGAGGEEGHGERGGLEEGLRTQAEGFRDKSGAPASFRTLRSAGWSSTLSAQQWPRGGAQPWPVLRGNRDPRPGGVSSDLASPETTPGASSLASSCLDSATGAWKAGWGKGVILVGPTGHAGEVEEKITNSQYVSRRPSQTAPGL